MRKMKTFLAFDEYKYLLTFFFFLVCTWFFAPFTKLLAYDQSCRVMIGAIGIATVCSVFNFANTTICTSIETW